MDVEQTLAALEQRLDALQSELHRTSPPRTPPPAADPLDQFGIELRRLAEELVSAWDRVVAHERGRGAHRIVLEAQADLHALAALERALDEAPRVRTVDLQAYAGGHASLVLDVS